MNTIRTISHDKHFFTADLRLAGFGQVVLTGDRTAVERLIAALAEGGHEIVVQADHLDEDR